MKLNFEENKIIIKRRMFIRFFRYVIIEFRSQ